MTDVVDAPATPANVAELIEALGLSWLAGRFGHKNVTTVSGWKRRGYIPGEYWSGIVSAAYTKGVNGISEDVLARWHAETRGVPLIAQNAPLTLGGEN
ncbi:hypothetical protein [Bosea massiliensis]|uniref:Helix-turn-helix DNA binding domain protein n=1 Tax=Bosea massiliensis TaxID=151419 RepID=A0ABW0PBS9_9HYPH